MMNLAESKALNFHHLRYFWAVAREGGITHASEALDVAPSTVSAQVAALEKSLGCMLFRQVGRNLQLTEAGQTTFRFAEEIFLLGQDLTETLQGRPEGHPTRLVMGIADVVPKQVAAELLQAAYALEEGARVVCREGKPEALLAALALRRFDALILDASPPPSSRVRADSEVLGSTGVALLARPDLARSLRSNFPASLSGAPLLLPTFESALRPALDRWFERKKLSPSVVGEFDDSALMKALAARGVGLVPVAQIVVNTVAAQYGLEQVALLEGAQIRLYLVTVERKMEHPALDAIMGAARKLFPASG